MISTPNLNGDDLKSDFQSLKFESSFLLDFLVLAFINLRDLILTGH